MFKVFEMTNFCIRSSTYIIIIIIIIIIMFIKIKPSAELIYNIYIWLTWETMSAFPEKRMPDCMLTSREGGARSFVSLLTAVNALSFEYD